MKVVCVALMLMLVSEREVDSALAALRGLIEQKIRAHVRESTGVWDGQCFTWRDLERFERAGMADAVAASVRDHVVVRRAVEVLRGLDVEGRARFLAACRRPLRPTWAEQGRIDRRGTTDAGRRAEMLIADRVSTLVERALALPSAAGAR